jgi:hypothetical protein
VSEFEYGHLPGRYPAIVRSYDQARRTCRVEIPGLTDGGDVLPEAEIEYPIGDKSRTGKWETEIEILPGDTVWVSFIGGDARYPIITGWRNPQVGNSLDWRRWHHANIESEADHVLREIVKGTSFTLVPGAAILKTGVFVVDAPLTIFKGTIIVEGDSLIKGNDIAGGVQIDGAGNTNHHSHVVAGVAPGGDKVETLPPPPPIPPIPSTPEQST